MKLRSIFVIFAALALNPALPASAGIRDCLRQALRQALSQAPVEASAPVDPAILRASDKPSRLEFEMREQGMRADDAADSVRYYNEQERQVFRVYAHEGRLYDAQGQLLESRGGHLIMDGEGRLYVGRPMEGARHHHSSYLAGDSVAFAGGIDASGGVITRIDNGSGHYHPPKRFLFQIRDRLREMGIPVTDDLLFHIHSKLPITRFDPRPFRDPHRFQRAIHDYDPSDWPRAVEVGMRSWNPKLRRTALEYLDERVPPSEEAAKILRLALQDSSAQVREQAVKMISRRNRIPGEQDYFAELAGVLLDSRHSSRARVEALFGFHDAASKPSSMKYFGAVEAALKRQLREEPEFFAECIRVLQRFRASHPGLADRAMDLQRSALSRLENYASPNEDLANRVRWTLQSLQVQHLRQP